ncbi:MAG TPA: MBL fold metallo-hydrolase [Stellaceae bacterium]|nr:MBL fold metallo-hydrolase [Stellaceae bacterium]
MELRFIGSGDAFGSGGRFNTCFLVTGAHGRFLIDCGATSLVALKQAAVDPATIDAVVISHLHGDHFGGLPFLLLDARLTTKRTKPLLLCGPPGLEERLRAAQEALFPGSSERPLGFALEHCALDAGTRCDTGHFAVTPFPAVHDAGAPCYSLRIECEGKVIAYSGDTEWNEDLAAAARGADLFICECSSWERPLKGHIDYRTLAPRLASPMFKASGAKRIVLTHMSPEMLERRSALAHETASDGMVVIL